MVEQNQALILIAALFIPVATISYFLLKPSKASGGGGWWAMGWAFLWFSAPASQIGGSLAEGTARICGTIFLLCLVCGSIEFSGRKRPRWLLPTGILAALTNGVLVQQGLMVEAQILTVSTEVPLFLGTVWALRPEAGRGPLVGSRFLQGLMGVGVLITLFELGQQYWGQTFETILLPLWIAFGFSLLAGQTRLFVERSRLEQKRIQEELRQSQKMETVGNLAGGVAHDFNNQLMVILGCLEIAQLHEPSEEVRQNLEIIRESAEHCASLTRSLLTFARRSDPSIETTDAAVLLAETERMLASTLPREVQLDVRTPETITWLEGDPTHVKQILTNLALNARDAIDGAGTISIDATEVSIDPGEIPAGILREPGRYVRLRVRDNGSGMTEDVRAQIFEPFFTTKGPKKGTGLGLAVVHGLAYDQGGWITVESALGVGSTFDVLLPAGAAPTTFFDPSTAIVPAIGCQKVVLLVDDEKEVRRVVGSHLINLGFQVLEACNGREALERIERQTIDFVLMDVAMPVMGGRETAKELRVTHPEIPILLMSGNFGPEEEIEGVHRLPKPFSAKRMVKILMSIASKQAVDGGAEIARLEQSTRTSQTVLSPG